MPTLKEESRYPFTIAGNRGNHEEIQSGCLQRIADATEAMAKNYVRLLADLKYYKEREDDLVRSRGCLRRRVAALRGVITKTKKAGAK